MKSRMVYTEITARGRGWDFGGEWKDAYSVFVVVGALRSGHSQAVPRPMPGLCRRRSHRGLLACDL